MGHEAGASDTVIHQAPPQTPNPFKNNLGEVVVKATPPVPPGEPPHPLDPQLTRFRALSKTTHKPVKHDIVFTVAPR